MAGIGAGTLGMTDIGVGAGTHTGTTGITILIIITIILHITIMDGAINQVFMHRIPADRQEVPAIRVQFAALLLQREGALLHLIGVPARRSEEVRPAAEAPAVRAQR